MSKDLPVDILSDFQTRPNSWAKQVRKIEWGHWILDFIGFWFVWWGTKPKLSCDLFAIELCSDPVDQWHSKTRSNQLCFYAHWKHHQNITNCSSIGSVSRPVFPFGSCFIYRKNLELDWHRLFVCPKHWHKNFVEMKCTPILLKSADKRKLAIFDAVDDAVGCSAVQ